MDVRYDDITSEEALAFCLPDPARARDDALKLVQAMIRNRCENFGDGQCKESKSIKVLQDYLHLHGLATECHARPERPERLNLISSIGSGSPRVMLGPGHVDVVPVNPDDASQVPHVYTGWDENPWSGNVQNGNVYGRGAVDMLGTVAAMAVVFVKVKESGVKLKGTLLFCAVSDEEEGSRDGVHFLLSDPGLKEVFRADYCVTELGGPSVPDSKLRPTLSFLQSTAEKGRGVVEIVFHGRPGHGSVPKAGDNALVRAAEGIRRISRYETPTVVTQEWKAFVKALKLPSLLEWMLVCKPLVPLVLWALLAAGSPLGAVGHASTRLTLSPNKLTGCNKNNVVPGNCTLTLDCRSLPEQDEEYLLDQVRRALGPLAKDKKHCTIRARSFEPATRSETGTPLWNAMEKAAAEVIAGATIVPILLPGATDCRHYRDRGGAVAYGANLLEPSMTFGELMKRFHGTNERLGLRSLWTSLQFYSLIVKYMMEC